MFTGIVKELGKVKEISSKKIKITSTLKLEKGRSVAVNGVCLTVENCFEGSFEASLSRETLLKTNLGKLSTGDVVNLEPSITLSTPLDGHLVTGHVDCMGKIVRINQKELVIKIPETRFFKWIAEKGSIAVDGISLTVAKIEKPCIKIALIPFTFKNTNLHLKKTGDPVNLEFDILAKYLAGGG